MVSSFATKGFLVRRIVHNLVKQVALCKGPSQGGRFLPCHAALASESSIMGRRHFLNPPASSRVLVTFDIDGTLIEALGTDANKMHKGAFSHALKELYGVDGTIDAVKVRKESS
jgi:hypothetical protein